MIFKVRKCNKSYNGSYYSFDALLQDLIRASSVATMYNIEMDSNVRDVVWFVRTQNNQIGTFTVYLYSTRHLSQ